MDDSQNLRAPVLDNHPHFGFKPLRTIWIVLILIILMLLVECITLCYVCIWTESPIKCDLFFLIVYAQVSLWIINFIARFYINWKHKLCLMVKGYFEFYETCSKYIEIPFYVSCVWIVVLTAVICIYVENDTPHEFYCKTTYYSPIVVVTTAISLQNAILIPLFILYIMKVFQFNKSQNPPDSENDIQWMPNVLQETLSSGDMGYRERGEVIDHMFEKQADLIRYYKEANEILNKRVLDLISQGRAAFDT